MGTNSLLFGLPKGIVKHFKSGPIQLNEVLSLPSKTVGKNFVPVQFQNFLGIGTYWSQREKHLLWEILNSGPRASFFFYFLFFILTTDSHVQ